VGRKEASYARLIFEAGGREKALLGDDTGDYLDT